MAFHQRNKHIEEDENWLITYADMITLLMAFFVILISMSKPDSKQSEKVTESLKQAGFIEDADVVKEQDPIEVVQEEIQSMIESNNLEQDMSVEKTDKGVQLELSSGSFYEGGSAKFTREAIPVLKKVADILQDFDFDAYKIQVEGHTDDVPMKSEMFPSNWELSSARAANIVRFFIADGLKRELLSATGYADVKPKVPNLDDQGNPIPENRILNRRVVVRIERID